MYVLLLRKFKTSVVYDETGYSVTHAQIQYLFIVNMSSADKAHTQESYFIKMREIHIFLARAPNILSPISR